MGLAKLKTKISVEDYLAGETVEFQSVEMTMPLDEIFRRVKFETLN